MVTPSSTETKLEAMRGVLAYVREVSGFFKTVRRQRTLRMKQLLVEQLLTQAVSDAKELESTCFVFMMVVQLPVASGNDQVRANITGGAEALRQYFEILSIQFQVDQQRGHNVLTLVDKDMEAKLDHCKALSEATQDYAERARLIEHDSASETCSDVDDDEEEEEVEEEEECPSEEQEPVVVE